MQTIPVSAIKTYLQAFQQRVCQFLMAEEEGMPFMEEQWTHPEGGGGVSRVLTGGNVIEKAGVNFSHVMGQSLPQAATVHRQSIAQSPFEALGVSIVVHPRNPYVPTSHANVRFIRVQRGESSVWWFGGGFDLTPYYGFREDCIHWHRVAKATCLPFGEHVYSTYKAACDTYFYLPHRQEPRGIGGLFFDDLNEWGFDSSFAFMRAVGEGYIQAYQPIMARRKTTPYTEKERSFQCYRRGRYVEFNLLYDRGTLFGLQSGGRTASILMSLPPSVTWPYAPDIVLKTQEEQLLQDFLVPRAWATD